MTPGRIMTAPCWRKKTKVLFFLMFNMKRNDPLRKITPAVNKKKELVSWLSDFEITWICILFSLWKMRSWTIPINTFENLNFIRSQIGAENWHLSHLQKTPLMISWINTSFLWIWWGLKRSNTVFKNVI